MALVSLPNSIDPATPAAAAEVQGNFTALRDAINGDIEGGVGNNLKADGITLRELKDAVVWGMGPSLNLQSGVYNTGDFKVTPGAGLALNWAAGTALIADPGGVISAFSHLIPVFLNAGSSVTIAANASGNPRIDRVILTLTGLDASGIGSATVSVLQGTATVGATLDNPVGVAAVPNGSILLADILMPNGFAGPFVANTHVRDRRRWAKGVYYHSYDFSAGDFTLTNTFSNVTGPHRVELTGAPVEFEIWGQFQIVTSATARLIVGGTINGFAYGTAIGSQQNRADFGGGVLTGAAPDDNFFYAKFAGQPAAAGSYLWQPQFAETTNDIVLRRGGVGQALNVRVREFVTPNFFVSQGSGANSGA